MLRAVLSTVLALASAASPLAAHEEKLAGGEWVPAGQAGARVPSLRFEAGRVSGSGGCNRFGGSYSLEGGRLTFSPLSATRMACGKDVMAAEQAFFDMLGKTRGTALKGDALDLLDGEGRVLASFTRRVGD